MRELSLFTGAGGGLLGTKLLGWTHVGYVEWNEYCQRVIAARIADGYIDKAPIFTDVREFVQSGAADQYRGIADVVSAGFPCQPFSTAGKQEGANDERNMWPATADVIRMVRPKHVVLENVTGLLACGYSGVVIGDLAAMGYVGKWGCLRASEIGAFHHRARWWVVAHADGYGPQADADQDAVCQQAGDGRRPGRFGQVGIERQRLAPRPIGARLMGVGNGVASDVDRIKAAGNGQVPAVAARAWQILA